jgi:4-diphosphocytidyl-2-C-methyl-D-erythritol kinase
VSVRAFFDLPAPAKLNLFLHVVGRRADGYHLLQSPFVLIDWADTIHVERLDDGRLERVDLGATLPVDDLCLRAARALQQAAACAAGARISIDKQVPWGAGLGGGSSDAATVLLALNRLWGLHWSRARLLELGATLGADVPFFVGGHNAFVEGIGERLTPMRLPGAWYAVLKPAASLPTAAIFASPLLQRDTEAVIVTGSLADAQGQSSLLTGLSGPSGFSEGDCRNGSGCGGWAARFIDEVMHGHGHNDLQPAAEAECTDVALAAAWLQSRYGNSRMTGSGSAVFARVGAGDQPVAAFPVEAVPPGWVGRLCRSLDHHPLLGWAD